MVAKLDSALHVWASSPKRVDRTKTLVSDHQETVDVIEISGSNETSSEF